VVVVDGEPVIRVVYGCDTEFREDVLLTRREWILATKLSRMDAPKIEEKQNERATLPYMYRIKRLHFASFGASSCTPEDLLD
jgi:hypothetical protein